MSAWDMTMQKYQINLSSTNMASNIKNPLNPLYTISLFLMWLIMMVAMMLPSAIPVVLMFDKISNERKRLGYNYVKTFNFVFSYIFIWTLFSILATAIHIALQLLNILNPMSLSVGYNIGALIFIFAGVYQMTPLKNVCLYYCRNPIEIFSEKKIFDNLNALSVGLKHGLYCVGCCWVLMFLLFYSGVMNLLWIAGLSLYVLIEKYVIKIKIFNYLSGLILIFWGIGILYNYN